MKKTLMGALSAIVLAGATMALPDAATASSSGRALTYGILGGLAAGALIGSTAPYYGPPPPPPYYGPPYGPSPYYVPAPPPRYYYGPNCYMAWQQYWNGYAWSNRRVRVCD